MFITKKILISIFIFTEAILNISGEQICDAPSKVLETLNGKIKGECYSTSFFYTKTNFTRTEVLVWMSVPYAEPPIKQNRFQNPIPVKSWAETRDGIVQPKACLQVGLESNEMSEDCLYLNIYVKSATYENRAKSLKPILVFIHGGSYTIGSSVDYDPKIIVAMTDIIVITINYRLNALGFLHVEGTNVKGNQAILDTTLALKWISENAKTFGGDNTKISISGESAGAWSVGFLLYYPKSWSYFRNGIMQSGGPTGISKLKNNGYKLLTSKEATSRAKIFFSSIGCTCLSYQESINCAKKKSKDQILAAYKNSDEYLINSQGKYEPEIHLPVIDNVVFHKPIFQLTAERAFKKCNIITGYNQNEASLFVIYSYFILGIDPENYLNTAKNFNFEKFYFALSKYIKYFPIYPYQDKNLVTRIYQEYFTSSDIININPANIAKVLLGKLSKIASDFQYNCQATQMASIYSRSGFKAYVYNFAYNLSIKGIPEDLTEYFPGPTHGDELLLTFGYPLSEALIYLDDNQRLLTKTIVDYWTNFVKYDDPNGFESGDVLWKHFAEENNSQIQDFSNIGRIINFKNNETSMVTGYTENHCDFWKFT